MTDHLGLGDAELWYRCELVEQSRLPASLRIPAESGDAATIDEMLLAGADPNVHLDLSHCGRLGALLANRIGAPRCNKMCITRVPICPHRMIFLSFCLPFPGIVAHRTAETSQNACQQERHVPDSGAILH